MYCKLFSWTLPWIDGSHSIFDHFPFPHTLSNSVLVAFRSFVNYHIIKCQLILILMEFVSLWFPNEIEPFFISLLVLLYVFLKRSCFSYWLLRTLTQEGHHSISHLANIEKIEKIVFLTGGRLMWNRAPGLIPSISV